MKKLSLLLKLSIFCTSLVAIGVLLHGGKASAAGSYYLPDPVDFSAGANVSLEISQPGSGITLDAPTTWIKFLYDPSVTGSQVGVQIGNGYFRYCGASSADSIGAGSTGCEPGDPDYDPGAVRYTVYYGDPATGGTTPDTGFVAAAVNSDDPLVDPSVYWSTIYNVPTSARAPIDVGGGNMRYVLYLKAEWNSSPPGEGRINSFKGAVIVAGGLASYWTGNGNYSIQDRLSPDGTQGTFNFGFAPTCDAPASATATLNWTDADDAGLGGVPADSNISFDLYEGDRGTTPGNLIAHIDGGSSPDIGGNNDPRSLSFTAKKDKVYLWRWNDVERINGIQMSIPYDSSNYYIECNGTIQGRVFYDENGNGSFDAGEPRIRNPSGTPCGAIYANAVINITGYGTTTPGSCNADPPGPDQPYYAVPVSPGSHTASLNPLGGWIITTGPQTINVAGGGVYDVWFGMRMAGPTITPKCSGGVSSVDISWPASIAAGSYIVDMDSDANFNGPPPGGNQFWNKSAGSSTNATGPSGFDTYPTPGGGAPNFVTNVGATYWGRVYFNGPNVHTAPANFVIKGCPKLTCGGLITTPGQPEDGVAFDMVVSFNNAGNGPLGPATLNVNFPGYYNANTGYSPYNPTPAGATASSNTINLTVPAGVYVVSWTVTGNSEANELIDPNVPGTCHQTVTVSSRPYFRAFGGDVVAGSNAACTTWMPHTGTSPGSIQGYSNGSGKGAGTQLIAQAFAVINGFSSAQGRTVSPVPDKGLTFANNGVTTYDGNFGAGDCPEDFWANRPTGAVSAAGNLNINPAMTGNRIYQATGPGGNLTLKTAGNKLNDGQVLVLYVDGDVTIEENIEAQNTSWSNANDIPSFVLIARGDIYIDSGVSAIDGVLIAQPRSAANGGNVYTCSIGHALPTAADMAGVGSPCKTNPLTITGAVVARTVKLFRSNGSLKDATNAEQATGPTAHAAERFLYSPEIWLRSNAVRGTPTLGTYDAITGLPPIF